jgi:hypothetical protein
VNTYWREIWLKRCEAPAQTAQQRD